MNPAAVEVKVRHNDEGAPVGEEVYYAGFYVGLVLQIAPKKWLAIPAGTKRLNEWAGVPRHEKRIDAVERLARIGSERVSRGIEGSKV